MKRTPAPYYFGTMQEEGVNEGGAFMKVLEGIKSFLKRPKAKAKAQQPNAPKAPGKSESNQQRTDTK